MIKIFKQNEPRKVRQWKKRHPRGTYTHLSKKVKRSLRLALLREQGYVCSYCGDGFGTIHSNGEFQPYPLQDPLPSDAMRIDHVTPQSVAPQLSLEFDNMCLSCSSAMGCKDDTEHCDRAKRNFHLPITPFMDDCHSYFSFNSDGEIYSSGKSDSCANETIKALKLDAGRLINLRKAILTQLDEMLEQGLIELEDIKNKYCAKKGLAYAPFFFVVLSYYGFCDDFIAQHKN